MTTWQQLCYDNKKYTHTRILNRYKNRKIKRINSNRGRDRDGTYILRLTLPSKSRTNPSQDSKELPVQVLA